MIQVFTFSGSDDNPNEAAKKAAQDANKFLGYRKVKREMVVAQSVNMCSVEVDKLPWIDYTITMIVDLPDEVSTEVETWRQYLTRVTPEEEK